VNALTGATGFVGGVNRTVSSSTPRCKARHTPRYTQLPRFMSIAVRRAFSGSLELAFRSKPYDEQRDVFC
jgi:hypothetical protein